MNFSLLVARATIVCACIFSLATKVATATDNAVELFVSTTGNDSFDGRSDAPFKTIERAKERCRQLRTEAPTANVTVWIAEGIYELQEQLEFTAEDNADQGQTTYRSLPGHRVVLRGGKQLQLEQRPLPDHLASSIPVSARKHLRVVSLNSLGIEDLDTHARRARHQPMVTMPVELFCGEKRLPLAGWPESGWATVPENRLSPTSWLASGGPHAVTKDHAAFVHGFWQHDWQDSCEPATLSPASTAKAPAVQVKLNHEHVGSVKAGARYRIENALSELDHPGEWYLDRASQTIVVWPTDEMTSQDNGFFLSTVSTPISCYDLENTTFYGLVIEGARSCCVEIVGGRNVTFEKCLVRHAGNVGINIYHGQQHTLRACEVTSTGSGAIRCEGGDRTTLESCGHTIEHCRLHDYCQLQLAYRPAVNVYGVGVTIRNNEIYDAPHSGIILHGNDHLIESNDIHHVCRDTDDVGAITWPTIRRIGVTSFATISCMISAASARRASWVCISTTLRAAPK